VESVGEDEDKLLIRIEGDNRGESGRLPLMPPEARSKLDGTDAVTSAYVAHMGISGRFNEVGHHIQDPQTLDVEDLQQERKAIISTSSFSKRSRSA